MICCKSGRGQPAIVDRVNWFRTLLRTNNQQNSQPVSHRPMLQPLVEALDSGGQTSESLESFKSGKKSKYEILRLLECEKWRKWGKKFKTEEQTKHDHKHERVFDSTVKSGDRVHELRLRIRRALVSNGLLLSSNSKTFQLGSFNLKLSTCKFQASR